MSLDLRLLVLDHDSGGFGYSHTMLSLHNGSRQLFGAIEKLPSSDPPRDFNTYCVPEHIDGCEESGYGQATEDPYGNPLRCVTAGELASLADHPDVTMSVWHRACWAMLAAMPADQRVVLWWH